MRGIAKVVVALAVLSVTCMPVHEAAAQSAAITIGFITDMSGPYSDIDGPGGAEAIRMAVADFGGSVGGKRIELLVFDHQNKTDLAATKSREWIDQNGVNVLFGGGASAANLAMARVAAERKTPFIVNAAGTTRLTNEDCTPYTIHYAYDTTALARVAGEATVKDGGKTWFILALDTAFGASMTKDATKVITENGGRVVGIARHPAATSDFSSYIMKAQSSGAEILGLADAGADTVNAIKSANEFGVTKAMRMVGMLMTVSDIKSLGLSLTQNMYLTDSWYWDMNAESRAWSKRFFEKMRKMPSGVQAAIYSSTLQYLSAVKATGSTDGTVVVKQMKSSGIHDMFTKDGYIRPDGRMVHSMYLMQVKEPRESRYPWDFFKVIKEVPGERAFTSKSESVCSLWK
ncbi:ABC transporter substrate-binding protein [Paraburkholderia panacisoli]|uniref:ABC transporter substrate-binding protein n=1 Tax=Paraburkholderia panacisoli TaxID=2603818 RepID=A0A5B0G950_9BURK|nr:ABC transporter substrate-binding protein [Paraburkholderia panacisoli]KAA0999141.1 ABC transporter substrate-binding protein [Paraburkholderia panacisoli]